MRLCPEGWPMPRHPAALSAVLLVTMAVPVPSAVAQPSVNGAIRGSVSDPQRAMLPGAIITAASPAAPIPFTTVSDQDGRYRLTDLPPGDYELSAERPGFARFVRSPIAVRAGLTLLLDVDMVLGSQLTTTEVRAETPMLESSSAVHAVNIAGEFQRQLPLSSRRDWADSLLLVPGVVATTQPGSNKVFYYLHGADFSSLVLQIDGADMASTLQNASTYINLSDEAIQDTQVKTGAIDAATPIGAGAVVSVVTRSGTNELKGSAGVVFQREEWNGNNAPGGTSSAFEIVQPDASLGGPLHRSKAWVFGAYRYTNNSLEVSRTPTQLANLRALVPGFESLTMDTRASYFFLKATTQLTDAHRLEAFWQRDHSPEIFVGPNWAGKFLRREFGGIGTGLRLASAWNNSLMTRVAVSFNNKGIDARLADDDVPSRNVHQSVFPSSGRLLGTGTLVVLDNLPAAADQPADKLTVGADITWYRDSKMGSHEIQTGIYFQPRLHERTTQHYANGGYALEEVALRDPSNPAAGFVPFHRQVYDQINVPLRWADSHDYAVYVQDAWRPVPRLTVNAGVRVDVIGRKDSSFNVETQNSTEIGPRLGVNYLVTRDGRRPPSRRSG